jgi:1,2-diacylglycerol-3-alpha-glucose alpha-1,2-glucosyltransferase
MLKVNFILELSRLSRITSAVLGSEMLGWITTYIPSLIEHLERIGVSVTIDEAHDDNFDLVHVHILGPTARKIMKATRKPVIFHAHGTPLKTVNAIARHLRRTCLSHFAEKADMIIFPSHYTKERYGPLPMDKKVAVLGNGVDLNKYAFSEDQRTGFRRRWGITGEEILVVSVGWFIRRKGALDFVELARRNPDHKFMWIGGPPSRPMLKTFLKLLLPSQAIFAFHPPSNLVLPGYLHDIPAALSAADIFLFPSLEENHPLAVLEAAACQRPIVARGIPALREWLEHDWNCLLANNLEDFQRHLDRLVDDETLREKLGRHACESVNQRFDIQKIAFALKDIYLSEIYQQAGAEVVARR